MTASTMTKLYRVTSICNNWPHRGNRYDGVQVTWLVEDREKPVGDYRALIADYDHAVEVSDQRARQHGLPTGGVPEDAHWLVDELFTLEEAEALARYLREAHQEDATIAEETMPIKSVSDEYGTIFMAMSGMPVGGSDDFYMLWRHEDYPLPFHVVGYYSMEQTPAARLIEAAAIATGSADG